MKKTNILNEKITAIYVRRSVSDKDKENNSLSIEAQKVMRNNLLNFAEFERETIAARVADAYNTKARETGLQAIVKV